MIWKWQQKQQYIQVTSNRNSHEISGSQNGEHKDSWNVTLSSVDRHWCLRGDCYLHVQDGRRWAWKKWVPQQYRYLSTKLHSLTSGKNTMLKIPIVVLLVQVQTHAKLHPTPTILDLPKQLAVIHLQNSPLSVYQKVRHHQEKSSPVGSILRTIVHDFTTNFFQI